MKGTLLK